MSLASIYDLWKRFSVGGIIDMAVVAAEVYKGADVSEVSQSPRRLKELKLKPSFDAATKYPEILGAKQFVFFGDTNHSNIALHEYFYSEENINAMTAAGIKHIFPEIEPRYQFLVDAVSNGVIPASQYASALIVSMTQNMGGNVEDISRSPAALARAEQFEYGGRGMKLMKERGMKIHCLDDRSGLDPDDLKQLASFMRSVQNFAIKHAGYPGIIHSRIMMKYLIENAQPPAGDNKLLEKRLNEDPALARRMREAAGTEKAAILFGAAHASDPRKSLFSNLGAGNAVRIDLYTHARYYADRIMARGLAQGNQPDYVHVIEENRIYKFG